MSKAFSDFEADLFKRILQGEAPFLGLFVDYFSQNLRGSMQEVLSGKPSPFETFLLGLERFPASFATFLIIHLMEGFGEKGYFEVYSHLEKAIGVEIPSLKREKLWRHFRKACVQLGLSVSPRTFGSHYMVDEYLRQAGFPLAYIPELTSRMAKLARNVNLPEDDEPEAISLWQQSLLELLKTSFSQVGREAIERDDQGYYVRLFLKLQSRPAQEGSLVEQKMQEALEQLGKLQDKGRFAIPQVLLQDSQLGVLLPGGQNQVWQLEVDGVTTIIRPQEGDHFFPFATELPKKLRIKGEGTNREYPLWENDADNRLLIFSYPAGKFHQGTALGEGEVPLKPGRYFALLRFSPEGVQGEVEQLHLEPSLFLLAFELLPGEELRLCRGYAELILHGEEVPCLNWQGDIIRDVQNHEIYTSKGFSLELVIPREFFEVKDAEYILTLKPGCLGEDREILLKKTDDCKTQLNVDLLGQNWKPGVVRLLVELKRRDSRRVLARSSTLWWNGLQYVSKSVFHCVRMPENMVQMENVQIDEIKHQLTFKHDQHRYFTMIFADGERYYPFTWVAPGIFLSLEEHGESCSERFIKMGSTLAVSASIRSVLKIATTDPATLKIGEFQVHVDFTRVGRKLIPLASIHEYVVPGADELTLRYDETITEIPLLRLSSPHEVINFQVKTQAYGLDINIALHGKAEAFRLRSESLITGEKLTCDFQENDIERGISIAWATGGEAAIYREEVNILSVQLTTIGWTAGWWVIEFEAKIRGKWGRLIDARGGVYIGDVITNDKGRLGTFVDIQAMLDGMQEAELEGILARVHKRLLVFYALKCHSFLGSLKKIWNQVFPVSKDFIPMETLMTWLSEHSSIDLDSNWLPYHHLGAFFPQVFSYPRDRYGGLQLLPETMLVYCLQLMPQLGNPTEALSNSLLHPAAAFGFGNIALVMSKGYPPSDFSLSTYRNALLSIDPSEDNPFFWNEEWRPGPGDYLGPRHYRQAICKLEENYQHTLQGNEERHGRLMTFLNKEMKNLLRYCAFNTNKGNDKAVIDIGLLKTECKVMNESGEVQEENLQKILKFLALWAQVCRKNAREPGILERFLDNVKSEFDKFSQSKGMLSYLLYVGEDIFAFYLLLWELVLTCDLDVREGSHV